MQQNRETLGGTPSRLELASQDPEGRDTLQPGEVPGVMWLVAGMSVAILVGVSSGWFGPDHRNQLMFLMGGALPVLVTAYWALAGPNRGAPSLRLAATLATVSGAGVLSLLVGAELAIAFLPLLALFATSDALSLRRRRRMLAVYGAAAAGTLFTVFRGRFLGSPGLEAGGGGQALLAGGIIAAVGVSYLTGRDLDWVESTLAGVALIMGLLTLIAVDMTSVEFAHVLAAALFAVPAVAEAWAESVDRMAWKGST